MTTSVQAGVDTSTVIIGAVKETTWGVTPASALQLIRLTGESLGFNISNVTSNEIAPDPQVRDLIQTDAEAAGSINFELSYGSFDDFLAAALRGAWEVDGGGVGVDELVCGTATDTFTIEKKFGTKYHSFTGMGVNTFSLSLAVGQIITGSFGFMGAGMAQGNTSVGTGTATAATTTTRINAVSNVGTVGYDGTGYTGFISSFDLSLTNNMRSQKAIGTLGSVGLGYGEQAITGNAMVYFEDGVIYQDYLDGAETSFSIPLTDTAGNSYTITLPRVKFTTGQVQAGGKNQDVMAQMGWQALKDSVTGSSIIITRNPA